MELYDDEAFAVLTSFALLRNSHRQRGLRASRVRAEHAVNETSTRAYHERVQKFSKEEQMSS